MRRNFLFLSLFFSFFALASSESQQQALLNNYRHVIEMADYSGQSYLSFMKAVVRPAMVDVVENGYVIASPENVEAAYKAVDKRVQKAVEGQGGLEAAKKVAAALEGQTVFSETLPNEIAKIDRKLDRYRMATFLGLASGGGVVIRYHENNYAYNVHYDKVEEKSGRSYGVGPTRLAYDASDKAYLTDVQEYFSDKKTKENLPEFYRALMLALLNTDPANYGAVKPFGQTVLSDFLAVYTAEQARNLMDESVDIHWDAALLEVTLLASFHAGQEKFKLYYQDVVEQKVVFTDSVYRQTPCELPQVKKQASMVDYWQFSRRINDSKNCKRSGINVTKKEFRLLERKITDYMSKKSPALVNRLTKSMGLTKKVDNVYLALSEYLINDRTEKKLGSEKVKQITENWVEFLTEVTKNADKITALIE